MLNGKRSHSPGQPYRNGNGVKMNGASNNQHHNPFLQVHYSYLIVDNSNFRLEHNLLMPLVGSFLSYLMLK